MASLLPEYDVVMAKQNSGPISGFQLIAEIRDACRFTSKGMLIVFAGVDAPLFHSDMESFDLLDGYETDTIFANR